MPLRRRNWTACEPWLERAGVPIVWSYFIRIDPNHTRNELVVVTPDGRMSRPTTKDHPVYAIGERSVTSKSL